MASTLFPSRVFELVKEIENNEDIFVWKCNICTRRAVVCRGSSGSVTITAVRKSHTILKCSQGFASVPDRDHAIESACLRLTEILKRRDKKEVIIAAFRACVAKFRTLEVPQTSAAADCGEDAGDGDAVVTKLVVPPSSVFNPVGRSVAKYFSVTNDRKQLFLGKVDRILPVPVRNSDRILVQVWKIVWDDADEEEMERAELLRAMALARRIMKYGPSNHGHEWTHADIEDPGNVENDFEAEVLDDEDCLRSAPLHVSMPQICNRLEDWNNPVAPGALQNKVSYCIDYYLDKSDKKVSNEFIRKRLRREAAVFGADLPGDIRRLAKDIGSRKLEDVVRHKCGDCDYAWIGPVSPRDFHLSHVCPDCGSPRYHMTSTGIKPVSTFFYFGIAHAIYAMHIAPGFRAAFKKNPDLTLNSYRNSPEGIRLNAATGGEAFALDNGLYVCFADGFRPHENSHQGLTGILTYLTCVLFTILFAELVKLVYL